MQDLQHVYWMVAVPLCQLGRVMWAQSRAERAVNPNRLLAVEQIRMAAFGDNELSAWVFAPLRGG